MGGGRSGRPASVTAGESLPNRELSPGWHERPYQTAELAEFKISAHRCRHVVLTVAVAVLLVAIGFLAGRAWPEEPDDCMAPLLATSAPLPHGLALDLRSENGAMALIDTLGRLRTPSV